MINSFSEFISFKKNNTDNDHPTILKEALNNSILEFSEHGKQKERFLLSFIFNGLPPLKMAAEPFAALFPVPQEPLNNLSFEP